jgi:epoxyqueuosine reductase
MQTLNASIERMLRQGGANLVGFADVRGLPVEKTDSLPRAISIGVALDPNVVREIGSGPTPRYFAEYVRINQLLGELGSRVAGLIEAAGGRALAISATGENFDPATLSMRFQHKTVATLAGLGWIGKSALLVTREFGPAVRLASVLTDAEIETGTPIDASNCGACRQCVDRCPAKAIVGENWQASASRESIYSAPTCRITARTLAAAQGIKATICGICIHACPWTQRYLTREC